MTIEKWTTLQAQNNFDAARAESSLLALPNNLPRIKPATIEQAMSDVFPSLATIRKYHGEQTAFAAVAEIIAQAAALLNVGKNLNPQQIEFLADEILRDWYWMTIGEIRFFMEEGIRGRYGTIYDRLDVNIVLQWLNEYDEKRTGIVENWQQKRAISASSENAIPMPQWFSDFIKRHSLESLQNDKKEFEPDDAFWEMIKMEWNEMEGQKPEFEKFKTLRLAQVKALFKR